MGEREGEGEGDVQVVERVLLEVPDGLGEEAGADEEQEVGHDDHEDGERCVRGNMVSDCPIARLGEEIDLLVRLANA